MTETEAVESNTIEELNRETPMPRLATDVTDNRSFYKRNHFPTPEIDPATWRLKIEFGSAEYSFTLEELTSFDQRTVDAILECAGNSRSGFGLKVEGEVDWGLGAVGTAEWTGVSLSTVLRNSGITARELADGTEAIFLGSDGAIEDGVPLESKKRFARSLPIEKALDENTIIALCMNGEVLPKDHGFPARLIVPGWYAMASVKWLDKIILGKSKAEFQGYFNWTKYVYVTEAKDSSRITPVTNLRVKSFITNLSPREKVVRGKSITIEGKAWSGEGSIRTVEVNFGDEWLSASIGKIDQILAYSWTHWSAEWTPDKSGPVFIRVRATDGSGNRQPETPIPNKYLYGYNAIQSLEVLVE